jgi:hypothetical protein
MIKICLKDVFTGNSAPEHYVVSIFLALWQNVHIANYEGLIWFQGSVCLVRILCLCQRSLMEESIGENATRIILIGSSAFIGIVNCTVLIFSGDISAGMVFNMITRQTVESGTRA